jgi:tRNA/rRNA methyltransferase
MAYKMAAKGKYILDNAIIYNDINSAISDLNFVIALTARNRYMQKKQMDFKKLASYYNKKFNKNTKIGILFGRENNGLTNEEVSLADVISVIPTDKINPSLNVVKVNLVIFLIF